MTKLQAIQRMRALAREIKFHNRQYYTLDDPKISDAEYDKLFLELKQLEEAYPEHALADSPTKTVGAPVSEKSPHPRRPLAAPMLSLDNAFTEQDIRDWCARVEKALGPDRRPVYAVEPKYDGLAVELMYVDGTLKTAVTRGDGKIGDEITENAKQVAGIPASTAEPDSGLRRVTGEIFMTEATMRRLNETREKSPFKTPRNAAAGSLKLLDPEEVGRRGLEFMPYGSTRMAEEERCATHMQDLERLRHLGFAKVYAVCSNISTADQLLIVIKRMEELREKFPMPLDGAVIKLNSYEHRAKMGETSHAPRWAIAYKFASKGKSTVIRDITIQVGRTGVLTPVAELVPVLLDGTTVQRATLHNADFIASKDVRIGDTVLVRRAGEVIPEIVEVVSSDRTLAREPFVFPSSCPVCGAMVARAKGEAATRCTNPNCPAKLANLIKHAVSRDALDIRGFGTKIVDFLVGAGKIQDLADLFVLTVDDFKSVPRIGEKTAMKLCESIQEALTHVSCDRWLYALGIPLVGRRLSMRLMGQAKNLQSLAEWLAADSDELKAVPTLGPVAIANLKAWFGNPENGRMLDRLRGLGMKPVPPPVELKHAGPAKDDGPLSGEVVVFTGTLSKPRHVFESLARAGGAETANSLTKITTLVVVGDAPGSKAKKAASRGITLIDEEGFLKLLDPFRVAV